MAARRQPTPTEPQPPRLEIRHLPTDSLSHYANNPRRNDPAVDRLIPLLREFGLRSPLLVRQIDGLTEVVDGHLRLKAAAKMGLAEVPTVDVSDLSEAQVRALRLAMNKSAEFAEWDDELLALELDAILALGGDLDLTGLTPDEVTMLGPKESGPANIKRIDVSGLEDRFWISVDGPLPQQAAALQALRQLMAEFPGVTVQLGTVRDA